MNPAIYSSQYQPPAIVGSMVGPIEQSAMRASVLSGGAVIKCQKVITADDVVVPTGPPVLVSSVFTPLPGKQIETSTVGTTQKEVVYVDRPVYVDRERPVYIDRPVFVQGEPPRVPEPVIIEKKVEVPVFVDKPFQKIVEKIVYVNQPALPFTQQHTVYPSQPSYLVGRYPPVSQPPQPGGVCAECSRDCQSCDACCRQCGCESCCQGGCCGSCSGGCNTCCLNLKASCNQHCATCYQPFRNCCVWVNNCFPRVCGMAWWIPTLLALLALAGIITALVFSIRGLSGADQSKDIGVKQQETCQPGYFFFNGQCVKCPEGSQFNGSACVKKQCIQVKQYPGRIPGKPCTLQSTPQ